MSTDFLFRADSYLKETTAQVIGHTDEGGIILDRTVFYPTGGGQPGDQGVMTLPHGQDVAIANTVYAPDRSRIAHLLAADAQRPAIGDTVTVRIDWELRYKRMRVHTALHLLTTVLPYPVTGGAIGDGEGRLDFDIPDAGMDKEAIAVELARRIGLDADVTEQWITCFEPQNCFLSVTIKKISNHIDGIRNFLKSITHLCWYSIIKTD